MFLLFLRWPLIKLQTIFVGQFSSVGQFYITCKTALQTISRNDGSMFLVQAVLNENKSRSNVRNRICALLGFFWRKYAELEPMQEKTSLRYWTIEYCCIGALIIFLFRFLFI